MQQKSHIIKAAVEQVNIVLLLLWNIVSWYRACHKNGFVQINFQLIFFCFGRTESMNLNLIGWNFLGYFNRPWSYLKVTVRKVKNLLSFTIWTENVLISISKDTKGNCIKSKQEGFAEGYPEEIGNARVKRERLVVNCQEQS